MNQQTPPPSAGSCSPLFRLDAYRVAHDVLRQVATLSSGWSGWADLANQAKRAASSVLLNIAEGAGCKPGSGMRRRSYEIARGSAYEVSAALDAAAAMELSPAEEIAEAQRAVTRLCGQIAGLIAAEARR
jgi:four helix bundle protein